MKTSLKKKIITALGVFMLAISSLAVPTLVPADASAAYNINSGIDAAKGDKVATDLFGGDKSVFTVVVNIMLYIIGALCVIMLIWGGIRYTTSAGNAAAVTSAKNTIMYAIVGLIIAFLAYAIVNWVLGALNTADTSYVAPILGSIL